MELYQYTNTGDFSVLELQAPLGGAAPGRITFAQVINPLDTQHHLIGPAPTGGIQFSITTGAYFVGTGFSRSFHPGDTLNFAATVTLHNPDGSILLTWTLDATATVTRLIPFYPGYDGAPFTVTTFNTSLLTAPVLTDTSHATVLDGLGNVLRPGYQWGQATGSVFVTPLFGSGFWTMPAVAFSNVALVVVPPGAYVTFDDFTAVASYGTVGSYPSYPAVGILEVYLSDRPTALFTSHTGSDGNIIDFDGSSSGIHDPGGFQIVPGPTHTGSQSIDPGYFPLSYAWDFGDGQAGTGVSPEHDYENAGTFPVTLTVTDQYGGYDHCTINVFPTGAGQSTLIHEPHSGIFYYGYISSSALRCARTFVDASFSTNGDFLVDAGPVANHGAFHRDGFLSYVYTKSNTIYLRESLDSGATWGAPVTLGTGLSLLGLSFEAHSGQLYCLVKTATGGPGDGTTQCLRAALNQNDGTWTVDSTTPANVSGLPGSLSSAPLVGEDGQLTTVIKSGTTLSLYNSSDGVNYGG